MSSPVCAWTGSTVPNVNILITPSTATVLTLEEAKLRAGLDWAPGDPRDAQMVSFIRAATERVARDTSTALLVETRVVYLSHLVPLENFPPPIRPLIQKTTIESPDPDLYPWAYEIEVGYDTVDKIPPLLFFAVGLLTAHYATAARDAVVIGSIPNEMPLGYEDAIADYRLVTV